MTQFRSKKNGRHYPIHELRTARPVIKDMYPFVKEGAVVEMGKYDYEAQKVIFNREVTIKKVHRSEEFLGQDSVTLKEIPGLFNKNSFYKKGTLERR